MSGTTSQPRQMDLEGKVAIVTGASRGIGRAIALNLACRGCSILGTCSSSASLHLFDSLSEEISNTNQPQAPKVFGLAASLTSLDTPSAIADAIRDNFNSHVDIFINNAAAVSRSAVGSLQAAVCAEMCLGNIQTPAIIIDELVKRKYFRKDSRIVFISSAESVRCDPEALMYATTKAASEAMARTYANAFGGNLPQFDFMAGTTSNSVLVGITDTDGPRSFGPEAFEAFVKYWTERQSVPRIAKPEDVADVVGLLCSRKARWITGSKVAAEGGAVKII